MQSADEIECGACADAVRKASAVAAGWKLVMDTHYDVDTGRAMLVHEWQCASCAPGAHSENAPGNGTSGGVELTDEFIERIADEAEQGYDLDQLKPRRRK